MKLIIGLGNPGAEYQSTRHNIGRIVVEYVAQQDALNWSRKKSLKACIAVTSWNGEPVCLAYPETMMNVSGDAVGPLARHFEISIATDLLILVDDLYLPFGRLRLRQRGSAGGHNGLKSIQESLATQAYPRLRIGIGNPDRSSEMRDYVLAPFAETEKSGWGAIFQKAHRACRSWVLENINEAMKVVNASDTSS